MEIFNYCVPTRVLFGRGSLETLHTLPAPGKKALLVTSHGKSHMLNGSFDKLVKELDAMGIEYVHFNHIAANPENTAVEEGAKVGRENNVDLVIALGGGSVMDASKSIAMLIPQHTDCLWDFACLSYGLFNRWLVRSFPPFSRSAARQTLLFCVLCP